MAALPHYSFRVRIRPLDRNIRKRGGASISFDRTTWEASDIWVLGR
jgi:hypothetical protein